MPDLTCEEVTYGQLASLTFLTYEICLTFDDEVNTIWSKPNKSWIKWQFLFTRYFALTAQIVNRTLEGIITSHTVTVTDSLKNWYMCQVVIGSILMSAVEILLMARVYALYNKNLYIGLAFLALIVGEFIAVVVGVVLNMPGASFLASSIILTSPRAYMYFGACAIVSQVTILVLTLGKYQSAVREGWSNLPVMTLMVRDGTIAFFIILFITTMTVVSTGREHQYGPIGNSWFLSVLACAGCRLIINMQKLPSWRSNSHISTEDCLTTLQLTNEESETISHHNHRDHDCA